MNSEVKFILDYEIRSNRIASFIRFAWGQDLIGSYFAWKVRRKYGRYMASKEMEKLVKY